MKSKQQLNMLQTGRRGIFRLVRQQVQQFGDPKSRELHSWDSWDLALTERDVEALPYEILIIFSAPSANVPVAAMGSGSDLRLSGKSVRPAQG